MHTVHTPCTYVSVRAGTCDFRLLARFIASPTDCSTTAICSKDVGCNACRMGTHHNISSADGTLGSLSGN